MDSRNTEQLGADDKRYVGHPFTSMGEWCTPNHEPIVLVGGDGAILRDSRGREFRDAYHGDTAGAASLSAAAMFSGEIDGFHFPTRRVANVEELSQIADSDEITAVVIEPVIQGAAWMKIWPADILQRLRECYLLLALTLVSHEVFEPFSSLKPASILFYGHSYTGNALRCAATRASLEIFRSEATIEALAPKIEALRRGLAAIAQLSGVKGTIGADDLAGDNCWAAQVYRVARERGPLTRNIRKTVIFKPPLVISTNQVDTTLSVLNEAIQTVATRKKRQSEIAPTAA
jgi:adenosylmethionine-8-amino-7-oxononanoate aminotransferase